MVCNCVAQCHGQLNTPACIDFECEVVVSNSNFKVKILNNRIGQTWGKYIYMKVEVIKEKVKYIRDIKRKVYQGYRCCIDSVKASSFEMIEWP